jgi:hypothetical protein
MLGSISTMPQVPPPEGGSLSSDVSNLQQRLSDRTHQGRVRVPELLWFPLVFQDLKPNILSLLIYCLTAGSKIEPLRSDLGSPPILSRLADLTSDITSALLRSYVGSPPILRFAPCLTHTACFAGTPGTRQHLGLGYWWVLCVAEVRVYPRPGFTRKTGGVMRWWCWWWWWSSSSPGHRRCTFYLDDPSSNRID